MLISLFVYYFLLKCRVLKINCNCKFSLVVRCQWKLPNKQIETVTGQNVMDKMVAISIDFNSIELNIYLVTTSYK